MPSKPNSAQIISRADIVRLRSAYQPDRLSVSDSQLRPDVSGAASRARLEPRPRLNLQRHALY